MTVLSAVQIADYAKAAGFSGDALSTMVAIALAESGGKTDAKGDVSLQNPTWGPSIGLWQVRSLNAQRGTGQERDELALYDPAFNAKSAWSISGGGKNFKPWSVFTNGAYKKFLGDSANAATNADARGGSAGSSTAIEGDISYPLPPPAELPAQISNLKTLESLTIQGKGLNTLIGDVVTSASINMTSDEITQITVTCADPYFKVYQGAWWYQQCKVDWDNWKLEVAGASCSQSNNINYTTFRFWPRGTVALFKTQGQSRSNVSAGQYIAEEVKARDMGILNYEAQKPPQPTIQPDNGEEQNNIFGTEEIDTSLQTPEKESAWATCLRLAREEGCWVFSWPEAIVVYGKPTIMSRALSFFSMGFQSSVKDDSYYDALTIEPELVVSSDYTRVIDKSIRFTLPRHRGELVRPGMSAYFPGLRSFDDGAYIITSVSWDISVQYTPVTCEAQVPVNPIPQPATSAASLGNPIPGELGQSADNLSKGTKSANDFVAFALAQVGDKYDYGARVDPNNDNPSAFDCSGLVQWAAAQVGISLSRTSGEQLAGVIPLSIEQAGKTRGALLGKKGSGKDGHVVISLGDGITTIEAMNTAKGVRIGNVNNRGFDAAGLIKGMNYGGKYGTVNIGPVYDPPPTNKPAVLSRPEW